MESYWLICYSLQYNREPAEYFNTIAKGLDRLSQLRGETFAKFTDSRYRRVIHSVIEISEKEYNDLLPCSL